MTTASPLETSASRLVAALRGRDGHYQAEAYEDFRRVALDAAAAGCEAEAIAACRFVMAMRPAGWMLSIPEAAGLVS